MFKNLNTGAIGVKGTELPEWCGVSEPLIERATFSTQRLGALAGPWLLGG